MTPNKIGVISEYILAYGNPNVGLDTNAEVSTNYRLSDDGGFYRLIPLNTTGLQYNKGQDYGIELPNGKVV